MRESRKTLNRDFSDECVFLREMTEGDWREYRLTNKYSTACLSTQRRGIANSELKFPSAKSLELSKDLSLLKPALGQNIALCVPLTAANSALPVSGLPVHLSSFFPQPSSSARCCVTWTVNETYSHKFDESCVTLI